MTPYAKGVALAALIPNGTSLYLALFTEKPGDDGTGGTECTGSGYARKGNAAWITVVEGETSYRVNNGAVSFDALSGALTNVVAWGLYTASSGGNLIDFGDLLDSGGNAVIKNFITGDQPRFVDQELKIGIGAAA